MIGNHNCRCTDIRCLECIVDRVDTLDDDGTIIEHYGDVLFQLGDVDKAIIQWEKARDLGEASENIDKKIADRKLYE